MSDPGTPRAKRYDDGLWAPRSALVVDAKTANEARCPPYSWSDGEVPVGVSNAIEAPSAVLAAEHFMRGRGEREWLCVDSPFKYDARQPVDARVRYSVWRYDGPDAQVDPGEVITYRLWTRYGPDGSFVNGPVLDCSTSLKARRVLAQPSPHVAGLVAEIARMRYSAEAWHDRAAGAAAELGDADVEGVLATMVYPPTGADCPSVYHLSEQIDEHFDDWMFRVQVAAAYIVSVLGREWKICSRASQALLSLALGPLDWTSAAAIVALSDLANRNPLARDDVVRAFRKLLAIDDGPIWYDCVLEPLVRCWPRIGGADAEDLALLESRGPEIQDQG